MNTDRLTILRDNLERRYERLVAADGNHVDRMLVSLWQHLQRDPITQGILASLLEDKQAEVIADNTLDAPLQNRPPHDDVTDLAVQCHLWKLVAADPDRAHQNVANLVHHYYYCSASGEREHDNIKAHLAGRVIDHVIERLSDQSLLFGTLVRYRVRSEVYNRSGLQALYDNGSGEAEKRLKSDLYLYLHDQGIDFVIEPEIDNSTLDVLATPCGDKKVVEVKVFDDGNRTKAKVAQGVIQTRGYARQHGVSRAYYVTYSMSQKHLVFEAPTVLPHLYEIRFSDSVVYALVVNIATPTESVSKRKPEEVLVTQADMGM